VNLLTAIKQSKELHCCDFGHFVFSFHNSLIGETFQQLGHLIFPALLISLLQVIFLLNNNFFISIMFVFFSFGMLLFRLKELLFKINFQGLIDQIISFIPGKERGKEHFTVDSGDRDTVVEDQRVVSLLDFCDVLLWDLDECAAKEDIRGVELWVET